MSDTFHLTIAALSLGIIAVCLALMVAAHAQTYQRLGDTIIGSDGSMAQQQPMPPPPRTVICQDLGSTVVCN